MASAKFGVEKLDELLGGELPPRVLTQVFGLKATGKSLLALQAAFTAVASGGSALVIDTEQGFVDGLASYWAGRLSKRFGAEPRILRLEVERSPSTKRRKTDILKIKEKIYSSLRELGLELSHSQIDAMVSVVLDDLKIKSPREAGPGSILVVETPDIHDLLALHGIKIDLIVSEGGRVEVRNKPGSRFSPESTPLGELLSKTGCSLLVYDSVSAPLKSVFVGTQDLPARSAVLAMLMGAAQRLAARFNVSVLAVNHATIHPHIQGYKSPYGGMMMGYDFKFIFHVDGVSKNAQSRAVNPEAADKANRAIWVYRHPLIGEYEAAVLARIGENGIE